MKLRLKKSDVDKGMVEVFTLIGKDQKPYMWTVISAEIFEMPITETSGEIDHEIHENGFADVELKLVKTKQS